MLDYGLRYLSGYCNGLRYLEVRVDVDADVGDLAELAREHDCELLWKLELLQKEDLHSRKERRKVTSFRPSENRKVGIVHRQWSDAARRRRRQSCAGRSLQPKKIFFSNTYQ